MLDEFKEGMRRLAGTVTVISTGTGDSAAGLTATAVCSLSMEPPRLLACLNRFGATWRTLAADDRFCVNLLPAACEDVALSFAGRDMKRFDSAQWREDDGFPPRLLDATSTIGCRVHSMTLLETHAIVVGTVERVWNAPADALPLLYHQQGFRTLCPIE